MSQRFDNVQTRFISLLPLLPLVPKLKHLHRHSHHSPSPQQLLLTLRRRLIMVLAWGIRVIRKR